MKPRKILQEKLKQELETLSGKTISNRDAWESYFNLQGFFRVLKQMKKEAYGTI